VIDAWLHPADIVAHDEENVRLLLLLRRNRCDRRGHGSEEGKQTKQEILGHGHGPFPSYWRHVLDFSFL
jgi:hypothetical protein